MRFLDLLAMRVRMLLGRNQAGAHLDDELRFHLERQTAENRQYSVNKQQTSSRKR